MAHLTTMTTASLKQNVSAQTSWLSIMPKTHGCIWFERPAELHWGTTFLDNLGVLTMQTPLLVLLHSCYLFFQPTRTSGFSFTLLLQLFWV